MTPILEPVRWAVVGAAATRLYMPERMTQDFDIAIAVADAGETRCRLTVAGLVKLGDLSIDRSQWQTAEGLRMDVIEGYDPWWPEALAEAQSNRDAQGLPILPLPYLTLMKFNASRTIDLGDISRMLGLADDAAIDRVRVVFQRYTPDDREDLESLIVLGRMEQDDQTNDLDRRGL